MVVMNPAPTQTFDLRGQPPDTLLDIVGKAWARAEPGAVIATIVDEPSYAERIRHWLADVDATLIEHHGPLTEVMFRVEPGPTDEPLPLARPAPMVHPELERCALLIVHDDHEALLAALLVANDAAAQGLETNLFFASRALELLRAPLIDPPEPDDRDPDPGLVQRLVQWMTPRAPDPSSVRARPIVSLPELIERAQQLGVRFTACVMSMSVIGLDPRDLHPYPNLDFGRFASFVDDARHSAISMVF
jgi:peroxiredoxin family protein/TusA-related sulfurtransferase